MIRNVLKRALLRLLTGRRWQQVRRGGYRAARRWRRRVPELHYFHQPDDPYSQLCAQLLPDLARTYAVRLVPHLVNPPQDGAAPDRAGLVRWSARDAALLAQVRGLDAPGAFAGASPSALALARQALAAALGGGRFVEEAAAIGRDGWRDDRTALEATLARLQGREGAPDRAAAVALADRLSAAGDALRQRQGHYLGATFRFEGEWYWGVDRLHHLEQRLREEGLVRVAGAPAVAPLLDLAQVAPAGSHAVAGRRPVLHFFLSFRSPYTWIALDRVRRLAQAHGAELRLRYVLPMVMRGLPVPRAKALYILADVAREARRLGLRFGHLVDPVGRPVERGYALLQHAMARGRGVDLAHSFLQGVWADGLDASRDADLRHIALRAGLAESDLPAALADDSWRAVAAANREELLALGLWGVPAFRLDEGPGYWGQDRLWVLERELARLGPADDRLPEKNPAHPAK